MWIDVTQHLVAFQVLLNLRALSLHCTNAFHCTSKSTAVFVANWSHCCSCLVIPSISSSNKLTSSISFLNKLVGIDIIFSIQRIPPLGCGYALHLAPLATTRSFPQPISVCPFIPAHQGPSDRSFHLSICLPSVRGAECIPSLSINSGWFWLPLPMELCYQSATPS